MNTKNNRHEPSKRDKLKPVELVGFSALLAVFAAAVVGGATRDFQMLVPVVAISVFIVTLMVLALLGLSMKPNPEDLVMRETAAEIAAAANAAEQKQHEAPEHPANPDSSQRPADPEQ